MCVLLDLLIIFLTLLGNDVSKSCYIVILLTKWHDTSRGLLMNTKNSIVISVFLVLQLFILVTFGQLKAEVNTLRSENQSLNSQLSSRLDHSLTSLRQLIDEQNRPIEQAFVSFGALNKGKLSMEVTFTVIPKELTPTTNVFLEFNDEKIQLTRNNSSFSLRKEVSIFTDELFPFVVIEDQEKQIISQDSRLNLYALRHGVIPMMEVHFGGEVRTTFDKSILVDGEIDLYVHLSDNLIKMTHYKVLYILDDKIVGRQNLNTSTISNDGSLLLNLDKFTLNKAFSENSVFSIVFIATNELGLEHEVLLVQTKYQNESSNTEFCSTGYYERIFSPSNELLWQSTHYNSSQCVLPSYR